MNIDFFSLAYNVYWNYIFYRRFNPERKTLFSMSYYRYFITDIAFLYNIRTLY